MKNHDTLFNSTSQWALPRAANECGPKIDHDPTDFVATPLEHSVSCEDSSDSFGRSDQDNVVDNGPELLLSGALLQAKADAAAEGSDESSLEDDKVLAKKLVSAGVDFVSSTVVSYGLAWIIGAQFTLPSFWRIIIGTGLAFATHAVRIYRIIHS
jgi:F0F1-type ATP synthase assembly protein I